MKNNPAYEAVRNAVRRMLPQYLSSQGIDTRKQFRCISPDHIDKHPSAGIVSGNPELGHCFSCGCVFDIFDAATMLEQKPSSGPGWLTDNLFYLASRFGIEVPDLQLDSAELAEIEAYAAYSHAAYIVRHSQQSERVKAKLRDYGWSKEVIFKFGIGSITSYDDYIKKMTGQYRHDLKLLEKLDLAGKDGKAHPMFNENNLFYTLRDEHGAPIGFSVRNLRYEEQNRAAEAKQAAGEEVKFWPRKYINSGNDNPLFHKSKTLFMFDIAKNGTGPLVIFEGNADGVTAYSGGIRRPAVLCGTAFTSEHLEMIKAAGIKHIIFVLDPDKAGREATDKHMEMVRTTSGNVGLRVEMIQMPGSSDADAFIRSFPDHAKGVAALRNLVRIDMFNWTLKKQVLDGEDPYTVCEQTIQAIVNEQHNLLRMKMADQLADACGFDKEFVRKEVLRRVDNDAARIDEEMNLIAADVAQALRSKKTDVTAILSQAISRIETANKKRVGYDISNVMKSVDMTLEEQLLSKSVIQLRTGNPLLDNTLGGIPRHGALINIPGKPHHGKSIWVDNIAISLVDLNDDVIVVLHTVDDSTNLRAPRIMGAKSGLDSKFFLNAGAYLPGGEAESEAPANFENIYFDTVNWYRSKHEQEKFQVIDTGDCPGDVMALRTWLKALREKYPEKAIVVIGDNFHLYTMETSEEGEGKTRAISRAFNDMVTALKVTVVTTLELPKEILKSGTRPKYVDAKGSGGLAFDAKININIYNHLQDIGEDETTLFWTDPKRMEKHVCEDGSESMVLKKLPVLEAIIDKNKVTGTSRTIFFELDSKSGQMKEALPASQDMYKRRVLEGENRRREEQEQRQLRRTQAPFRRQMVTASSARN